MSVEKPTNEKEKKSRIKIACERCRKQRRKCDGGTPCGNCSKKDSPCQYPTENNRKPPNKRYLNSLLDEIETLQSVTSINGASKDKDHSSITNFRIESNVNRLLKSSKLGIDFLINSPDVYKLDMDHKNLITFHGPTSFRHMSSPPSINRPSDHNHTLRSTHTEFLQMSTLFFKTLNRELPIVDEVLIQDPDSGFVSDALKYSILAFTSSRMGDVASAIGHKEYAISKVMGNIDSLHITQVQALLILGILEMNDNHEVKSSCYISMACALSNHLGLHLDCSNMAISNEEKSLREKVFWCTFIIDRSRYPILGVGPYLDSVDISAKLAINASDDPTLLMREFCILLDITTRSIQCIYSLQYQIEMKDQNKKRQMCAWKDAQSKILNWEIQLPPICRLRNQNESHPNKSLLNIIQIFKNLATILTNKPFYREGFTEKNQKRNNSTVEAATNIIKLCDNLDFNSIGLNYVVFYSLYISTVCSMLYLYDKNRTTNMISNIKKGFSLLNYNSHSFAVCKVYLERALVVKKDWKVNLSLEEDNKELNSITELDLPNLDDFKDIDFGSFFWDYGHNFASTENLWDVDISP